MTRAKTVQHGDKLSNVASVRADSSLHRPAQELHKMSPNCPGSKSTVGVLLHKGAIFFTHSIRKTKSQP